MSAQHTAIVWRSKMEKIIVLTDVACESIGNVDELSSEVPRLTQEWNSALKTCADEKREIWAIPSMSISAVNSKNFQVIGMLYKVIRAYQRDNEYPRQVKIICSNDEIARMYRVVYNFYVPRTKDDRMADDGWN